MYPNIIQYTTSKARVCFVNVPDEANTFGLQDVGKHKFLCFRIAGFSFGFPNCGMPIKLPPGEWQLLPRLSQVSEEQWRSITGGPNCECLCEYDREYCESTNGKCWEYKSPELFGRDFARSLNIPEDQDPVVLVEPKK